MIKKIFICVLLTILVYGAVEAQYKINKTKYDYRTWQLEPGDPYNPGLCGGINVLVPGVGQMIAGEGGRGAAFLGGYAGGVIIYAVGAVKAAVALDDELQGGPAYDGEGLGLMVVGVGAMLTIWIWSIVDGVRVAKVNNLAFRDKHSQGYEFKLEPYVAPLSRGGGSSVVHGGLSLQVRF